MNLHEMNARLRRLKPNTTILVNGQEIKNIVITGGTVDIQGISSIVVKDGKKAETPIIKPVKADSIKAENVVGLDKKSSPTSTKHRWTPKST